MTNGVKFYKIRLIKKLLHFTNQARNKLLEELIIDATDPTIIKRRIRTIRHLNLYENQLLEKIQNFQTDDVTDLNNFNPGPAIQDIVNRNA